LTTLSNVLAQALDMLGRAPCSPTSISQLPGTLNVPAVAQAPTTAELPHQTLVLQSAESLPSRVVLWAYGLLLLILIAIYTGRPLQPLNSTMAFNEAAPLNQVVISLMNQGSMLIW
jgi:hypothetical protein